MDLNESSQTAGRQLFDLAKDHLELASLEWEYSKKKWRHRLFVWGGGALFFLSAFIFFNVALAGGLQSAGFSLVDIGLLMGTLYLGVGGSLMLFFKRRLLLNEDIWQGSRDELKRSSEWITKRFF